MPIYAFKCSGCDYTFDEGMSVATFKAKKADAHGGFRFKTCGRCKRKGRIVHDALRQYQSQSPPQMDSYTFYENAPDAILRGERQRTVTKSEAKRLLSEHGLMDAGKSAKVTRKTAKVIDRGEIAAKWEKRFGDQSHGPAAPLKKVSEVAVSKDGKAVNPLASGGVALVNEEEATATQAPKPPPRTRKTRAEKVEQKKPDAPKVVDIMRDPSLTMNARWPTLKKTAKRLKLNASPKTKRPELERLIQDAVRERQQSAAK